MLDNMPVKAGQVLVRIDARDYEAKVEQARAALALAQSQAKGAAGVVPLTAATTNSGISAAEADAERARLAYQEATTANLALAQANVAKSQASYDKAKADLDRMKPLADKAEISQQEYDGYVEAASVAQGQLDADKQKLQQAQQNIPIAKANLDAAEARLADARANSSQVSIRTSDASAASAGVRRGASRSRRCRTPVELHEHRCPHRRLRHAQGGGSRGDRAARPGFARHRAAQRSVGDRRF